MRFLLKCLRIAFFRSQAVKQNAVKMISLKAKFRFLKENDFVAPFGINVDTSGRRHTERRENRSIWNTLLEFFRAS